MRATLELPDPLFREVKARAAQSGLKLKELLTRSIEAGLKGPHQQSPQTRPKRVPNARRCPRLESQRVFLTELTQMRNFRRFWIEKTSNSSDSPGE